MVIDNPAFMAGWLRGFFDGEGSIFFRTHSRAGKRRTIRRLSVGNTDIVLMHQCSDFLSALGIDHTKFNVKTKPNRKPFFELHVTRGDAIKKFAALVGFSHPEKATLLEVAVAWINRPRTHYHASTIAEQRKSGASFRQIAKNLGYAEGAHTRMAQIYDMEERKWLKNG